MVTFVEDEEVDLGQMRMAGYLADCDEGVTERGEKDLSSHDEDVFCIEESLPLFP